MAGEVLTATSSGCPTNLANGSVGEYLGIGANGQPTWLTNPGGPSSDSSNALLTGSDGKAYISCEEIQDCIGTAIAAGLGLTYNDALNAISGALAIPITSGNGAPAATTNSPTVYTDNVTGNVYYRDTTGATVIIGSSTGQTPLTANDSATIDFTASGVNNHTITASVINDPTGGLTATASGESIKVNPASNNLLTLGATGALVQAITGSGIQGDGTGANAIRENFDALPTAPVVLPATTTFVVASDGANPNGSQATAAEVLKFLDATAAAAVDCARPVNLLGDDGSGNVSKYTTLFTTYDEAAARPSVPITAITSAAANVSIIEGLKFLDSNDVIATKRGATPCGTEVQLANRRVSGRVNFQTAATIIVPTLVFTPVTYANVNYLDSGITYNNATGEFTVAVAGDYVITANISYKAGQTWVTNEGSGHPNGFTLALAVFVNGVYTGSLSEIVGYGAGSNSAFRLGGTINLRLNAGDTIGPRTLHFQPTAMALEDITQPANVNNFEIARL